MIALYVIKIKTSYNKGWKEVTYIICVLLMTFLRLVDSVVDADVERTFNINTIRLYI